jgi:hypothetical protein
VERGRIDWQNSVQSIGAFLNRADFRSDLLSWID